MGVKGKDDTATAQLAGVLLELLDQTRVSAVNPIKVSDGQRTAFESFREIR